MNANGAVGLCPSPRPYPGIRDKVCRCGKCVVCGFQKHMAAHMHPYGDPEGPPFGHRFKAKP